MFAPYVPGTSLSGWMAFSAIRDRQQTVFARRPDIDRELSAFRQTIPDIDSPEALVASPAALRVALGASDLSDDIANRFFLQKVLQDGVARSDALANRLQDARYRSFATWFGASAFETGSITDPEFLNDMAARHQRIAFERAVGEQNDDYRLALAFERALPEVAEASSSNSAAWFQVMASRPLRSVFETVFGLPTAFGQLDIDRQHEELQDRARRVLGSSDLKALSEPEAIDKALRLFFVRRQAAEFATSGAGQVALQLLSTVRYSDS